MGAPDFPEAAKPAMDLVRARDEQLRRNIEAEQERAPNIRDYWPDEARYHEVIHAWQTAMSYRVKAREDLGVRRTKVVGQWRAGILTEAELAYELRELGEEGR